MIETPELLVRLLKISAWERAKAGLNELYVMQSTHLPFASDDDRKLAIGRSKQLQNIFRTFIETIEGKGFHK